MSGIEFQGETEQSLIEGLCQGRQDMLSKLYDAYAPAMMGVISRIVQDNVVAEEVLKETFTAVWSRIGIYDSSRNRLLTWGLAIARGLALNAVKTGRYTTAVSKANKPAENGAAKNKSVNLQNGHIRKQDICTLAPLEKRILELIYLKGYTCAETAGELKMTVVEIKLVLRDAFVHLKAEKSV